MFDATWYRDLTLVSFRSVHQQSAHGRVHIGSRHLHPNMAADCRNKTVGRMHIFRPHLISQQAPQSTLGWRKTGFRIGAFAQVSPCAGGVGRTPWVCLVLMRREGGVGGTQS